MGLNPPGEGEGVPLVGEGASFSEPESSEIPGPF